MAEGPIKKSEVIEQAAIEAPLELANNFESADKTVKQFVEDSKKIGTGISKSNSFADVNKVLKQLADQEKQIIDLQKKLNDAMKPDKPKAYSDKMRELTAQLKSAQGEMAVLAQTVGEDSDEFVAATKKAGELQDQINAVKEAAKDASGGSGFERLTLQMGRFSTQVRTLDFKGASASLKALANTSKNLTFKEATDGIGGFGKAAASVGKALLTNPIFIIAAVIVSIVVAVVKLRDSIKVLDDIFIAFGEAIDWVVGLGKKFLDFVGATNFALQEKTDKLLANNEKERKSIEKRYDTEIALASAAGQSTIKMEQDKQQAILKSLSISIYAIDQEIVNNKRLTSERKKELQKQREDLMSALEDASLAFQVARVKEVEEERKKNKELQAQQFQLTKYKIEQDIEAQKAIVSNENKTIQERFAAERKLTQLKIQLAGIEAKQEVEAAEGRAALEQLALEKRKASVLKAGKEESDELDKIWKAYLDKRKKDNEEYLAWYRKEIISQVEADKKAIQDTVYLLQNGLKQEEAAIKEQVLAKQISVKEGEKLIQQIHRDSIAEQVQIQIIGLRKILDVQNLSVKEREETERKLSELQLSLTDAYYNEFVNKSKGSIDKVIQVYQAFSQSIGDLFQSFTDRRLAQIDAEAKALESNNKRVDEERKKAYDLDLERYRDNADKQAQIKKDFEATTDKINKQREQKDAELQRKRREATRKQALYEKSVALAQGVINVASAVIAALVKGPIWAAAIAAAGAIELAAIALQPIPAAAKGMKNFKGGKILVGEEGRELITIGAKAFLTKDKPTIVDLPSGSDIYPAKDTARMLAGTEYTRSSSGELVYIGRKIDILARSIEKKRSTEINITERGLERVLRNGEIRTKILNDLFR